MTPDTALHPLPEDALELVHGGAGKIALPGTSGQPGDDADLVSQLLALRQDNADSQDQQITHAQSAMQSSIEEKQDKMNEMAAKMQEAMDKHGSGSVADKIGMAFEQLGAIVQFFAAVQVAAPQMPGGNTASLMTVAQQSLETLWGYLQPVLEQPQVQQMLLQHGQEPGPYDFLHSFSEAMQDGHLSQPEMIHMFQSALPLFTGQGTGSPTATVTVGGTSIGLGGSATEATGKHRG
ncbi:hypothetical protein [Pseudoroseomonas cervicalis]|uniref:hypothetical protein n=1 Tax=Teichococcus cervicalis TaxID=204525 RepID=UPI00277F97F4|nr:hypothetical protein [Pseudoroseomonas cervicalis]MDQ1081615.1 hypothetical protein [Pseudoroseomonas cervicalis]